VATCVVSYGAILLSRHNLVRSEGTLTYFSHNILDQTEPDESREEALIDVRAAFAHSKASGLDCEGCNSRQNRRAWRHEPAAFVSTFRKCNTYDPDSAPIRPEVVNQREFVASGLVLDLSRYL